MDLFGLIFRGHNPNNYGWCSMFMAYFNGNGRLIGIIIIIGTVAIWNLILFNDQSLSSSGSEHNQT